MQTDVAPHTLINQSVRLTTSSTVKIGKKRRKMDQAKEEDHEDDNRTPFHFKLKPMIFEEIQTEPRPEPRSGHRSVCDDANLYSFGGYSKTNSMISGVQHNLYEELWCFNFAESRWKLLPTTGDAPKELASHCAVLYGNYLHVFGGTGTAFGESTSNKLSRCDLRTLIWEEVSTTGTPPAPQYGQALVLDEPRRQLYIIGGTSGHDFTMDIHKLDLVTKIWSLLYCCKGEPSEPRARYRHEVAFDGKTIYVFGGGTAVSAFSLRTVPSFNLESGTWTMLKTKRSNVSMGLDASPDFGFPGRRKCHSAVQLGNDVYICGGCNGTKVYNDMWKFHIPTRQWEFIPIRIPVPLSFHTASLTPDGSMYLFGGVSDIEKSIRTNQTFRMWLKIPSLKDMCWEALLASNQIIKKMSHQSLMEVGIPKDYARRVHPSPPGGKPDAAVESHWKSDLLKAAEADHLPTTANKGCISNFV